MRFPKFISIPGTSLPSAKWRFAITRKKKLFEKRSLSLKFTEACRFFSCSACVNQVPSPCRHRPDQARVSFRAHLERQAIKRSSPGAGHRPNGIMVHKPLTAARVGQGQGCGAAPLLLSGVSLLGAPCNAGKTRTVALHSVPGRSHQGPRGVPFRRNSRTRGGHCPGAQEAQGREEGGVQGRHRTAWGQHRVPGCRPKRMRCAHVAQ